MKNNTSTNPTPLKKKLASRFLKKLKRISSSSSSSSSSSPSSVRAAAYASMASAVGPRRAWSRAILRKIRGGKRERRRRRRNPRKSGHEGGGLKELSEVVPGGEAMDSWKLLNETAHYITCLTAQLQIMRQILHSSSSSTIL